MSRRINYAMLGLFVVVLSVALIGGVLWLSSGKIGRVYDEYLVYMQESVSGLARDSAVKYYGVDVGRVHEITLGPTEKNRVRLLLQIDAGTPVREDTIATLEVQGLTGLAYINLLGGHPEASALKTPEGEELPVIRSEPSIWGRLDRSLGELVDNLIDASERLQALLSDENQAQISITLSNLNALSEALASRADRLSQLIDDAAGTVSATRSASERLPVLLDQINGSALAVERMAQDLGEAGIAVRRTVETGGKDFQRFTAETLPEIQILLRELKMTAENLRRFSEELERDPGVIFRGSPQVRRGPGE